MNRVEPEQHLVLGCIGIRCYKFTENEGLQHAFQYNVATFQLGCRKDLENVLQLPMESFQLHFNDTLRCIARFFLRAPGMEGSEGSVVKRFVEESQVHSPKLMASCREASERGETCRLPNGTAMPRKLTSQAHSHVASRVLKHALKAALEQTKGWKQFIPFADLTYEAAIDTANTQMFGCPKV